MSKTIAAIFDSYRAAEDAARQVKENGLRTDDISIVAKDSQRDMGEGSNTFTNEKQNTNDNVSDGAVTGGVLGGVAGLLLGMGTMVIPGLGVIAAAGPIAGLLSGAVTGGIVGGLVDLGIPEEAGKKYEKEVQQGRVLWSMRTNDDSVDKVSDILNRCGAKSVDIH